MPISWRGESVGVDVAAAAWHLGVAWRTARGSRVSLRLGAGAGVERVSFSPTGDAAALDLAPASGFWSPEARVLAAADVRLADSLALSVRASGDIALMDVHYDLGGNPPRRVLSPFPLRAGIGLGLAWRL